MVNDSASSELLMQHDPYTWEIDSDTWTFVADQKTKLSIYLNWAKDEVLVR